LAPALVRRRVESSWEAAVVVLSPGWTLEVERGPDWLIVTLFGVDESEWSSPPLAGGVWSLAEQNFTYRVVLDLSHVPFLHTALVGQLVNLQKRVCSHDGCLRLCGLSDHSREVLQCCRLDGFFPLFHDRNEAVMGSPAKPR
jgi:anti-anti-sigma factor